MSKVKKKLRSACALATTGASALHSARNDGPECCARMQSVSFS